MNTINLILILLIMSFIFACGGGESQEQKPTEMTKPSETEQKADTMTQDIRTIDIIGIDEMKFTVKSEMEGITVGDPAGSKGNLLLLETIEAQPGEQIRIRLTTRSQLPPSAMSHNWVL